MPVKHYSSGMYMRLGFAVAIHVEPDILLVDEVLAVGDATFQRKCLDQIDHMRREGVTVLFVSHSTDTIRALCSRVLWLNDGQLVANGSAEAVIARYLARSWAAQDGQLAPEETTQGCWGSGLVRVVRVRLLDATGRETQIFEVGAPLTVELHYQAHQYVERPVFGLAIHRSDGVHVTGPNTQLAGYEIPGIAGAGCVRYTAPALPLLEGTYHLSVAAHNWEDTEMYDYHDQQYSFRVIRLTGERYGLVTLGGAWSRNDQTHANTS